MNPRSSPDSSPSPAAPAVGTASFRFGIVILAAGASTRMGEPKQLLVFDGRPLLVRAVDAALASAAWPVVVVLGAHAEKIRPLLARHPVLISENPAWAEGMASSVRAGAWWYRHKVFTPASRAIASASSGVECPQCGRCRYSSTVNCVS